MSIFRSFSEIVNSMLGRLKLVQPNLDTKPGTVSRDLFIDIQADQIEKLYKAISLVSKKQSLASATGQDLDQLSRNFSLTRRNGSVASGIVIFSISDIFTDISIPDGTIVSSRSGATFKTVGSFIMTSAEKNKFAANANRMRTSLNLAGINDTYAVEVPVQGTKAGKSGNIGIMQIIDTAVQENLKVTNISGFSGGTNRESDPSFRARILAIFSGSNTGTAAGYKNAALGIDGVIDVLVVEPGNTLMLRDGTEIIEVNDGTSRILNSGTGGKVDIYILGKLLNEITESFIYSDVSGSGDASDERNDYILGVQGQDTTMTSDERRLNAFKTGNIPLQPVDMLVQVSGTKSGIFTESFTDDDGNESGNYELVVDENADTGGTPFGFDKLHWISNVKNVESEVLTKSNINEIGTLNFVDIESIDMVYRDVSILSENSTVSSSDRSVIQLNHYPITKVSRVTNKTTGEVYTIEDSNVDEDAGVNENGLIQISGRTLPTQSDTLSCDYTWRMIYDKFVDYNGAASHSLFRDHSVVDAIDWGVSNGIFEEKTLLLKSDDGLQFTAETSYNISRVISIYKKTISENTVEELQVDDATLYGITLSSSEDTIDNVLSVVNSNKVELYNTELSDGTFSSRTIYFPSDSIAEPDEEVVVYYNQVELFDVDGGDGAYFDKIVTLPSSDILTNNEVFDDAVDASELNEHIYLKYVANLRYILPALDFSLLPIIGVATGNNLMDSNISLIEESNQPIFYVFDDNAEVEYISRFGASKLNISVSNTTKNGKIKILGTTLNRIEVDITAGTSVSGLTLNLSDEIEDYFGESSVPSNVGIARVDSVVLLNSSNDSYDILGYELLDNSYDIGSADINTDLSSSEFALPSTINNSSISFSSGDEIRVSFLVYKTDDSEEIYFSKNESRITNKTFGSIARILVSSGFRNSIGDLVGSLSIISANQPSRGQSYYADYNFTAPKEGERVTVQYNINQMITDVTVGVEVVRPITADILVKEAEELIVDVEGMLLINEDSIDNADSIVQDVSSVVTSLLNTSSLAPTIDYSDIISTAAGITGVDSVDISLFNTSGEAGRKSFIRSLDNQTISAGSVVFTAVTRDEFRIS